MQESTLTSDSSFNQNQNQKKEKKVDDTPSRSITPTQNNSISKQTRSSSKNLFVSYDNSIYPSPEQPYLDLIDRPNTLLSSSSISQTRPSSSGSNFHSNGKSRAHDNQENVNRRRVSSSHSQSRKGSGSGSGSSSSGHESSNYSPAASTSSSPIPSNGPVSWLSLALFSDDTDDEHEQEQEQEQDQNQKHERKQRQRGSTSRERRNNVTNRRSTTPDRIDHNNDSIDISSNTSTSNSASSSDSSSFLTSSRRFHQDPYSTENRKTRRSASMMSPGFNDRNLFIDSHSKLNSNSNSNPSSRRPSSGINPNKSSSPFQSSVDLLRTDSLSSNRGNLGKHGLSRSISSSDSCNINIPSSSSINDPFSSSPRIIKQHELNPPASPKWTTHARKLSSSLSKSASPFIKAGLDELRDIFDVESERNGDYGWREKEWEKEKERKFQEEDFKACILPLSSSSSSCNRETSSTTEIAESTNRSLRNIGGSRHKNRPSTAPVWLESSFFPSSSSSSNVSDSNITPTISNSPNLGSNIVQSNSSSIPRNLESKIGNSIGLLSPPNLNPSINRQPRERQRSAPPNLNQNLEDQLDTISSTTSHSQRSFTERSVRPGSESISRNNSHEEKRNDNQTPSTNTALTLEMDAGSFSEPEKSKISTSIDVMTRRRVGLGLVLMSFGILGIEVLEYIRDPNSISPHLIAFFSIQPLFAFIGFIALLTYNLSVMDLVSRGIRAHVLAQACVGLMALKELASTATYGTVEYNSINNQNSNSNSKSNPSLRFGKPFQSVQKKIQDLVILTTYQSTSISYSKSESASHAHETKVGNISSQLIYLIVFLTQALFPIFLILFLQYWIGRRLSTLVRESRENLRDFERKRIRNRTLEGRKSFIKSPSSSSTATLNPVRSIQKSMSTNTMNLKNSVLDKDIMDRDRDRRDLISNSIPQTTTTMVTSSSGSLDPKDLSNRLKDFGNNEISSPSFSDQIGFSASPRTLSPDM